MLPDPAVWRRPLLEAVTRVGVLGAAPPSNTSTSATCPQPPANFADTPKLGALIAELASLQTGTVFDPSCGSETLLHAMARHAPGVTLYGQDIDPAAARLARVRLQLAGADADIRVGDSLRADAFPVSPPTRWSSTPRSTRPTGGSKSSASTPGGGYSPPARKEPELAWVQHLPTCGPAVPRSLCCPPPWRPAAAAGGSGANCSGVARCARSSPCPPGLATPMGTPLTLWILRNPEDSTDLPGKVLLFDASDGRIDDSPESSTQPWSAVAHAITATYRGFLTDPDAVAKTPGRHRAVPLADLLDEAVDVAPGRYVQRLSAGPDNLDETRSDLMRLSEDLVTSLPGLRPATGTLYQAMVTLGELSRIGGLDIVYRRSGEDSGDDEPSLPALTAEDIERDTAPSGRVRSDNNTVQLQAGDVVLPRIARRPVARVITDEQAALHSSICLLRPNPEVVDPWFLADSSPVQEPARRPRHSRPGVTRIAELFAKWRCPACQIAEQRAYGDAFRRLHEFRRTLRRTTEVGDRLWWLLTEGLAVGTLRPEQD